MTQEVLVGSILTKDGALMTKHLGLDSEPYSSRWRMFNLLDGAALDSKIRTAGWTFFFMAAETKVMFFGSAGAKKVRNAVTRVLEKVAPQHFNGLQVTEIAARHFLGVPYTEVTAHSRHFQQSCRLDGSEQRQAAEHDVEWAKG